MKFALLVAFASLSVTASSAFPAACGPNADILSESSFGHEEAEVKLATISCPGSDVRGRSSLVNASKRQVVTQCDAVAHPCIEVDCDFRPEQPLLPDCIALTTALNGLADPVLIPARTGATATLGTCTYVYVNIDTVEYSLCGSAFGALGSQTTTSCATTSPPRAAGICFSPGVPGNDWLFEVLASSDNPQPTGPNSIHF
ncbi:hypothetical protein B0H13DRAFT_2263393 [Mycena leptocephala]|nr:hypothetical protein B0H13DRAFT_2263393 [Mycena leptocephala]